MKSGSGALAERSFGYDCKECASDLFGESAVANKLLDGFPKAVKGEAAEG
jgi:hypothetical protein